MITETLSAVRGPATFTPRSSYEDSPERREQTRLAVARAKQGDQMALRFLYSTYSCHVYGYVRSILRDDHEAEDVTQHVFAKLITVVTKYEDRGVPFFAWLLRLSRNVAIDHMRANRFTLTDSISDTEPGTDADPDQARTVKEALATLPNEQREVVFLRHVVGLTPGEIAERMGRTESSIHGLHHRGRRALQLALRGADSAPCARPDRPLAA